jgi:hypothetical protein
VTALSGSAGNRAVADALTGRPVLQRTPETDVIAALDNTIPYLRPNGELDKAWGVLNGLSMTDMLATMGALDAKGRLAVLVANPKEARKFGVARLLVGVATLRLSRSGKVGDPAELAKLAAQIEASGIGGQVAEIETFLRLPPSTLTSQRPGVNEPDATQQGTIRSALEPASASSGVAAPPLAWDGAGTDAKAAGNRKVLKTALGAALEAHLTAVMPSIKKTAKAPKLPMTALEGAGKEAKRVVDATISGVTGGAVLTSGQASTRAGFSFAAGTNLVDLTDPKNYTPNPEDVASWIAETDPAAARAASAHHFERTRSPAEQSFLDTEVIAPFVARHKADLALYDVLGFAITLEPGKVAIQPHIRGDNKTPKGGGPSPAERSRRWIEWETLVHEYIHTLEHPAFGEASKGRRVMKEGFCELFTKMVLTTAIPKAQAGDPALQVGVEGADSAGKPWPGFSGSLVPNYSPRAYAAYLASAEKVVSATSMEAAKASFFQGHVELIGLSPDGSMAPAVAPGSGELVTVPSGVTSVFALAVITNSTTAAILAANAGLKAADPLPATVRVPGVVTHTLVAAEELRPTGGAIATVVEGPTQIGTQHGLAPDAIIRANPGKDWTKAKAGDRVIVPVH